MTPESKRDTKKHFAEWYLTYPLSSFSCFVCIKSFICHLSGARLLHSFSKRKHYFLLIPFHYFLEKLKATCGNLAERKKRVLGLKLPYECHLIELCESAPRAHERSILDQTTQKKRMVRPPGIEPGSARWERAILPLDQGHLMFERALCLISIRPRSVLILSVGFVTDCSQWALFL